MYVYTVAAQDVSEARQTAFERYYLIRAERELDADLVEWAS